MDAAVTVLCPGLNQILKLSVENKMFSVGTLTSSFNILARRDILEIGLHYSPWTQALRDSFCYHSAIKKLVEYCSRLTDTDQAMMLVCMKV